MCFSAIDDGGLEFRGSIIRTACTLRGGDRPITENGEFSDCCTLPRSHHEPWGLFRKPLEKGLSIPENLRKHGVGALHRDVLDQPFKDLIKANRPSKDEYLIALHPNVKPQKLMRELVHASLPLGRGIILDPFMGSGSTIAASIFCQYQAIGIEADENFFNGALKSIPELARRRPSVLKETEFCKVFD